ncbi:MAG: type II secretion system F family protein, partial [Elusimicrobia bacterium]|nr:type II secretion system F family protein [Elusimicrobiota bacterium]
MIIILLKALISFLAFGAVFFLTQRVFERISREKIEKEQNVRKRESVFARYLNILERNPASQEAKVSKLITATAGIFLVFAATSSLFLSVVAGLFGFFVPQLIVNIRKERKAKKIDEQLADGLVLIANSLKAGMSFPQTLEVMARQGTPPLSSEFAEVSREVKFGVPMEKALANLAGRWPKVANLRIAVIAINIAQEVGGNLSETLSRLSETMRKRKEIQGK